METLKLWCILRNLCCVGAAKELIILKIIIIELTSLCVSFDVQKFERNLCTALRRNTRKRMQVVICFYEVILKND